MKRPTLAGPKFCIATGFETQALGADAETPRLLLGPIGFHSTFEGLRCLGWRLTHAIVRTALLALLGGFGVLAVISASGQPGSVDSSFASGIGAANQIFAIAPTPDGKILVGGLPFAIRNGPLGQLARVTLDGAVDSSFQLGILDSSSARASVSSIVSQPDGKILVGGNFTNYAGVARSCIARLNTDGTLDTSFDPGTGLLLNDQPGDGYVTSIGLQSDGRILVSGWFTTANGLAASSVARFNTDGSVDTNFNANAQPGVAIPRVLVQADGRILIAGNFKVLNGQERLYLARLNVNGSVDETFNASMDPSDWIAQMALQPDGRIILSGSFADRVTGSVPQASGGIRVLTLRLNPDGSLDPNFIPLLNLNDTSQCRAGQSNYDAVLWLALQTDGKIIAIGAFSIVNGIAFQNVARLNPDGTLDGTFDPGTGADGQVTVTALESDGNVLISGCFNNFDALPALGLIKLQGGEPAPTAPVFKIQPIPQVLNGGKAVNLTALISAFPVPSYRWQLNGHDLAGAVHPTLILTNLSIKDAGSYQLLVTNSLGSVISKAVLLTAPSIIAQPSPQTVHEAQDAAFSVIATNSLPLSFQWQFAGTNLFGATNATLVLTNVHPSQAGNYAAVVSDSVGSVSSSPALLTVLPSTLPTILVQPVSQTVEVGVPVSFSVVATNYLPLTFQWQYNATNIPGATQPVFTLRSAQLADAGPYRVVVSSEFLVVTSEVAHLSVSPVEFIPGPGVVTNLDQASLQTALNSGAPVTFGVNGTITLTNRLLIETDTTVDGSGRTIFLDGNSAVRHFVVTNSATLRLISLTLANGRYVGAVGPTNKTGYPGWGGSIYNAGGTLELSACKFMSNQVVGGTGGPSAVVGAYPAIDGTAGGAAYGGSVYSTNGWVSATNCLFANNTCTGGQGIESLGGNNGGGGDSFGGAIYSTNGSLALVGVTFTNNLAQAGEMSRGAPVGGGGGMAFGGALADVASTTAVSNSTFAANQAIGATRISNGPAQSGSANGGALFHGTGAMTIEETLFAKNTSTGGGGVSFGGTPIYAASGNGGAVFNQSGSLKFRNCALMSNEATGGPGHGNGFYPTYYGGDGSGGGIYNEGALSMINCTLVENSANGGPQLGLDLFGGSAYGGAFFASSGSASFVNVTVASNSVQFGPPKGPAALGASIANSTVILTNTILSCSAGQTNVSGTITDGGHNICSDASAAFTASSSRMNLDPTLGPLAYNGGPTPTLALLPASPAIDAGDNSACPPTDQRGVPRPQGLSCDIGAFELAPTLTITREQQGLMRLDYAFQAGKTNLITGSTNLFNWVLLGTRVSDINGQFEFEDPASILLPLRFYQVQIQSGQ